MPVEPYKVVGTGRKIVNLQTETLQNYHLTLKKESEIMNFDNPTKSYGTAKRYAKLKLNLERLDVYANLAYDYHDDVSVLSVEDMQLLDALDVGKFSKDGFVYNETSSGHLSGGMAEIVDSLVMEITQKQNLDSYRNEPNNMGTISSVRFEIPLCLHDAWRSYLTICLNDPQKLAFIEYYDEDDIGEAVIGTASVYLPAVTRFLEMYFETLDDLAGC